MTIQFNKEELEKMSKGIKEVVANMPNAEDEKAETINVRKLIVEEFNNLNPGTQLFKYEETEESIEKDKIKRYMKYDVIVDKIQKYGKSIEEAKKNMQNDYIEIYDEYAYDTFFGDDENIEDIIRYNKYAIEIYTEITKKMVLCEDIGRIIQNLITARHINNDIREIFASIHKPKYREFDGNFEYYCLSNVDYLKLKLIAELLDVFDYFINEVIKEINKRKNEIPNLTEDEMGIIDDDLLMCTYTDFLNLINYILPEDKQIWVVGYRTKYMGNNLFYIYKP